MPTQTNGTDLQDKSLTSSNFNLKRAGSLPRIDKSRSCKTYRTPPTPPLEKQSDMEKEFKLDCIAVSNISLDYSRANPKMGTVIPPYNSLNDSSISEFVKSYGVKDFLKRNGMKEGDHESMAGKVHDDFFKTGAGYRYLNLRNQFGNGHHAETVDGHQRYMAEQPRVMISYNNMNGYRRNIPKLRCEPPSTFSVDPRWYERVRKTYKNNFTEEELLEHFKNTYMIGYPFHDNNYNHFHPSVKYVITVKTGSSSLESYNGNVGINIVSRNFDTGFIKLDSNIAVTAATKSLDYKPSKVKCSLFKRNQKDVFEFEDQDIRTISAIILSRDGKGDELLYLDYVVVEIHKSYEKNTYRFPFDGWLRMARQDKKTELLKQRFGKRNSIIVFPNEVPKFEYRVKISPQITKNTEYTLDVCYEIKKIDATSDYKLEFSSDLPISGNLIIRLNGTFGRSETFKFNRFTRPDNKEENDLLFTINSKDVGEIKSVSAFFDESEGRVRDYELTNFKINDNYGNFYEFEINQFIKSNKEVVIKSIYLNNELEDEYEEPPSNKGKLEIQLVGQTESTGQFELKNPIDSENGVHTYTKKEANIGNIKSVRVRFEGEKGYFAWIKSIQIKSNKNQEFSFVKNISIKNFEEIALRDNRKNPRIATAEQDINRQVFVQIFGDKKKSSLFQLKNASSDDDTLDVFSTTDNDLGKITNVFVKYQDKSDTKVQVDFIEVIDPRGNSYRFRAEVNLKGGRAIMLPRKSGPISDGSTTGTDLEGTVAEAEGTLTEVDGTATEPDIVEEAEQHRLQTNPKDKSEKNESDAEEIPD